MTLPRVMEMSDAKKLHTIMQEKLVRLISYASSHCTWKYLVTMPLGSTTKLSAQHYAGNDSCSNFIKYLTSEKLNRDITTLIFHGFTSTVCKHWWLVWPDILPQAPNEKSPGLFCYSIMLTRVSHYIRNECAGSEEFSLGIQASV